MQKFITTQNTHDNVQSRRQITYEKTDSFHSRMVLNDGQKECFGVRGSLTTSYYIIRRGFIRELVLYKLIL